MFRVSRAAIVLGMALLPALAHAQDASPSPEPTPAPLVYPTPAPGQDGRPVLNLTLEEAVARTLANNVDIAVQRYNPEASALGIDQLRGFYEPYLTSTLSKNSRTQTAQNVFAGGNVVT